MSNRSSDNKELEENFTIICFDASPETYQKFSADMSFQEKLQLLKGQSATGSTTQWVKIVFVTAIVVTVVSILVSVYFWNRNSRQVLQMETTQTAISQEQGATSSSSYANRYFSGRSAATNSNQSNSHFSGNRNGVKSLLRKRLFLKKKNESKSLSPQTAMSQEQAHHQIAATQTAIFQAEAHQQIVATQTAISQKTERHQNLPDASILSLSYKVNNGPARVIDLRNAETQGHSWLKPGDQLSLVDLWYSASGEGSDGVNAEVYVGAQQIGLAEIVPFGNGPHPVGDFIPNKDVIGDNPNTWEIQNDWTDVRIVLVLYEKGEVVEREGLTLKFSETGSTGLADFICSSS